MSKKRRNRRQPDITVVVYGRPGVGKSALIGEIADFLTAHQCRVTCVQGAAGEKKTAVPIPEPGRFHARPLHVKMVEQWADTERTPPPFNAIRIPCEWICPECGQMEEDELAKDEWLQKRTRDRLARGVEGTNQK